MVALAFLMPIVASMGGNAGMQTLAVTIRALATKELSSGNFRKNCYKRICYWNFKWNNFCNNYRSNSSIMV